MKKGEFEKRIKQELEHQRKLGTMKPAPTLLMGSLLEWIREAKQEFPMFGYNEPLEFARKKWFVKWFGERSE